MEDYSRRRHEEAGYEFVNSPHITKSNLFETRATSTGSPTACSRRWSSTAARDYYLKPMNCPFHILIYRSRMRSYRELPLRFFEFGTVYRYEKSGVVHGLTRVRGMTQDDAHIFCTHGADRRRAARRCSSSCSTCCATTASTTSTSSCRPSPRARRSAPTRSGTRPPRRCARSPRPTSLELVMDEGGGAFYGPKISVQARDAIGRTWQMSTIQLDFQLPQRFELEYVGADNERHRPVMIHRALFGSIERFFAILVEHYAGAFPAWLAPVQVDGAARGRPPRRLRARGRRPLPRRGLPRRGASTRTTRSSARASARPRSRRCRTCSWSATTTSSTAPSA